MQRKVSQPVSKTAPMLSKAAAAAATATAAAEAAATAAAAWPCATVSLR